MMKKYLLFSIFAGLILASTVGQAQANYSFQQTTTFTSATSSVGVYNIGTGAVYHYAIVNVIGTVSACLFRVDSSADGITWTPGGIIASSSCTANTATLVTAGSANWTRVTISSFTGTGSVVIGYYGYVNSVVGMSRTQDGNGKGIGSTTQADGTVGLMVSIGGTNFALSAGNSTTAQLATTATFTGTIESIINTPSISMLLISDQPGTLVINQYITSSASSFVSSWSYPITAGVGFSRSFVANGNYFNLTFQNTGASTTTTLNINTYYGSIMPSNNLGNMPMSIADVNGIAVNTGHGTAANSERVELPSDGTGVVGLNAGANLIGKVGVDQTTSGTTNAIVPIPITAAAPAISNGSLATLTASVNIKASAGNVYGIAYANGAASVCWVECVNSASAGTLGTAPLLSIPMGASATGTWTSEFPVQFSSGIACGIATAPGGASACGTAGNITVFYK